jgi:hypothetical protein
MRTCDVSGCDGLHEGRGYCKRHYKSLLRYDNPLQVDINQVINAEKRKVREARAATTRKNYSAVGVCSTPGCENPVKARKLCETHYARIRRKGSTERTTRRLKKVPEKCLVIDCGKDHYAMGYCQTHRSYDIKYGSPYLPKIIKLCGVVYCLEDHFGRGMCREHYNAWKKETNKYLE